MDSIGYVISIHTTTPPHFSYLIPAVLAVSNSGEEYGLCLTLRIKFGY